MKKAITVILAAAMGLAPSALYGQRTWDGTVASGFSRGWGSYSSPYVVSSAAEFAYLIQQTQGGNDFAGCYIELANDIVFNTEMAQSGKAFAGVLDGRGHRIYGLNQQYELFSTISGTIRNLGLENIRKARSGFAQTVSETGRIVNCYFQGALNYWDMYDRYKTVYGFAAINRGIIENSYVRASSNVVPDYWVRVYNYVNTNYDNATIANCYSTINWNSYGATGRHKDWESNYGVTDNLTTDLTELNTWAESHGTGYSAWENEETPELSIFVATRAEQHTVTFNPVFGTCPEEQRIVVNGHALGNLPMLDDYDGMEFAGWFNGTEAADDNYPVYSDMTLTAHWRKIIIEQPTTENPTVTVSDPSHAIYQWFKASPHYQNLNLAANSSGSYPWVANENGSYTSSNSFKRNSSSTAFFDINVNSGDKLSIEYSVSSEEGYDRLLVTWKGQNLLDKSGSHSHATFEHKFTANESGRLIIAYSKDDSSDSGDDRAIIHSCHIGSSPIALDSHDATLDFVTVGHGDNVFCEVTYTNDATQLVSDRFVVDHPSPYKLYIVPTEVRKAGLSQIPVYMKNAQPVVTFQCELTVPEGLEVARNSHGDYEMSPTSRFDTTHTLLADELADGNIIVVSYSSNNASFSDNDGVIFSIPVHVTDRETPEFDIVITNVSFTTSPDLAMVTGPNAIATISVADYEAGDANADGMVNATDIATIVGAILGNPPADYVASAADINADGTVNATDIANLVDIIMHAIATLTNK